MKNIYIYTFHLNLILQYVCAEDINSFLYLPSSKSNYQVKTTLWFQDAFMAQIFNAVNKVNCSKE